MIYKFNDFINEGIRDAMKPKTKEDVLDKIGNANDIKYYRLENDDGIAGREYSYVETSYKKLVELFGEPNTEDWNWKNMFHWYLEDSDGNMFQISDKKEYEYLSNNDLLPKEEDDGSNWEEIKNTVETYVMGAEELEWFIISTSDTTNLKNYILYHTLMK